jgi:hypothetical protein
MGLDGRPKVLILSRGVYKMNQKQKKNLLDCYKQIDNDLPILFTLFDKVEKQTDGLDGHIICHKKKSTKKSTIQYSLQLQKNDGKTRKSNLHIQKMEYYCFWVSHRFPLKKVDYYCLVCPDEPNIRIFVKKDDLKTGINYFKFNNETIFSDGTRIWDYSGLRDETIKLSDVKLNNLIKIFKTSKWKDIKFSRDTSQSLWLIKTYKGTPQEFYTKSSITQIYKDNSHWNYVYKNQRTTSIMINRNSKNNKWTMIGNGDTKNVEYWVIKGELNVDHKLLLKSFQNN